VVLYILVAFVVILSLIVWNNYKTILTLSKYVSRFNWYNEIGGSLHIDYYCLIAKTDPELLEALKEIGTLKGDGVKFKVDLTFFRSDIIQIDGKFINRMWSEFGYAYSLFDEIENEELAKKIGRVPQISIRSKISSEKPNDVELAVYYVKEPNNENNQEQYDVPLSKFPLDLLTRSVYYTRKEEFFKRCNLKEGSFDNVEDDYCSYVYNLHPSWRLSDYDEPITKG